MSAGRGAVVVGVLLLSFLVWLWRYSPEDQVAAWLEDNSLGHIRQHPRIKGLTTLQECATLDMAAAGWKGLDEDSVLKLENAVSRLDLKLWLQREDLGIVVPVLSKEGYASREALYSMELQKALEISQKLPDSQRQKFLAVLREVQESNRGDIGEEGQGWTTGGILWSLLKWTLFVLVIVAILLIVLYVVAVNVLAVMMEAIAAAIAQAVVAVVAGVIYAIVGGLIQAILSGITGRRVQIPPPQIPRFTSLRPTQQRTSSHTGFNLGLYERIRGTYLDADQCRVEWNHENNTEVGGSSVTTIHLVCKNSSPYDLQMSDDFKCSVTHLSTKTTVPHVVEPAPPTGHSTLKVSFTTRATGRYCIDIKVNGKRISGSPFTRNYLPGPVDASKTVFIDQTHVIVVTRGTYHAMTVVPKDSFGNTAIITQENLTVEIRKDSSSGEVINPECVVDQLQPSRYELLLKVEEEGHYVGCVKYQGQRIGPPNFTIICLSGAPLNAFWSPDADAAVVEKNISKKNLNTWYEAQQAIDRGRTKKVYCYISPKQLQVREYFMRIIPTRLFTCKVCPATRVVFHAEQEKFTLDDGFQQPITLTSPHREILGATFYKFVLKNIGGSEKFQDKQQFFFTELKKHHSRQSRSEIRVNAARFNLLNSAMQSTKHFGPSDWCKKFVVEFRGEEALDWGGVSREFFELLCVECFDASNGNSLFRRFKDSPQALVHPNHQRGPRWKLKHFEFAGRLVGKCLYESAMGNLMLVKARFTRSFLAQLIGLRINHKYFEYDDPDLYVTKVQYIKENDVTDLGLVFAEEEFGPDGGNPKIVPLIEHGEEIEVAEKNKLQYLNLLAQYRLAKCVKEEIDHFLKGLNDIVPDNLLSIFDENELELLMCGMGRVSFEDLKEHAVCSGNSWRFQQVVSWFWTIVSSFTQEEMARLLQFVTGCSQLPPGGFKELSPRFQITAAPTHGRLPTAHTCFNQLCLPDYDSCEQFQSALMLAINEGAEGFGFL